MRGVNRASHLLRAVAVHTDAASYSCEVWKWVRLSRLHKTVPLLPLLLCTFDDRNVLNDLEAKFPSSCPASPLPGGHHFACYSLVFDDFRKLSSSRNCSAATKEPSSLYLLYRFNSTPTAIYHTLVQLLHCQQQNMMGVVCYFIS